MSHQIIFLDLDGVLNSTRSIIYFGKRGYLNPHDRVEEPLFDPLAVAILRRIVEGTSAKIVISSSWRIGPELPRFHDMFDLYQWNTRDIIIDKTPDLPRVPRGVEIKTWLDQNQWVKYVILDDDDKMLDDQRDNFVHVDGHTGLSFNDMVRISNILDVAPGAEYMPEHLLAKGFIEEY